MAAILSWPQCFTSSLTFVPKGPIDNESALVQAKTSCCHAFIWTSVDLCCHIAFLVWAIYWAIPVTTSGAVIIFVSKSHILSSRLLWPHCLGQNLAFWISQPITITIYKMMFQDMQKYFWHQLTYSSVWFWQDFQFDTQCHANKCAGFQCYQYHFSLSMIREYYYHQT